MDQHKFFNFRMCSFDHTLIELGNLENGPSHKRGYVNSLSCRQMDSLTALCDTLLPSLKFPGDSLGGGDYDAAAAAAFYRTSASMTQTHERVGEYISGKLKHPKLRLLKIGLWLLSTWIGTFIFCGRKSFSKNYPYFLKFSQISEEQRQEILLSWSLSSFFLFRMLFKVAKFLTLYVFFSEVDEEEANPSWKGIGYCGPDPDFKPNMTKLKTSNQTKFSDQKKHGGDDDLATLFGPLYKSLLNPTNPREMVMDNLRRSGFPVSVRRRKPNEPSSISSPSLIIECDAVVIGSGSGGGVVAGVLAKAGYKVLVLEKGNYSARSNLSLLEGKSMEQMYLSGGILATADLGVLVLAGATVGGGSSVNWSASIRTPQHVINEWSEKYGLELFQSKMYREAMDVVCEKMGVQNGIKEEGFNNEILRKGCEELGFPVENIPRNGSADHYCGWCSLGCKDGKKQSTSETWLVDLVNSGNGVILPGCEAVKVLQTRKKGRRRNTATGVAFEFEYKGVKEMCVVKSAVSIVAGGALSTPAILKRSGLKNPNIGKNLHLHPVTMAWGYFPDGKWPEKRKKSYEGGIMTAMSSVVADLDGTGYGALIQTPSLHPGMFSTLTPWISGTDFKTRMERYSRTAHIFALARDQGSGTVISPNSIHYKINKIDEKKLQKGLEKVLRILAAAGAEEIGTHHCNGKSINVKKASITEFERFVKEESSRPLMDLSTPICSAHQMGSCRMGVEPAKSAVNEVGETWEVDGLYVADTSVFPTALGVNPMVTVQTIAYCTAQSVLDVLKRKKKC